MHQNFDKLFVVLLIHIHTAWNFKTAVNIFINILIAVNKRKDMVKRSLEEKYYLILIKS